MAPKHRRTKAAPEQVNIVNVGYRSTNYWVVSAGTSRLLVDLGWPGTMGQMRASLARMDVPLEEIQYGLATHYHIDHAGLAEAALQRAARVERFLNRIAARSSGFQVCRSEPFDGGDLLARRIGGQGQA